MSLLHLQPSKNEAVTTFFKRENEPFTAQEFIAHLLKHPGLNNFSHIMSYC
jgi:hypothetical protein